MITHDKNLYQRIQQLKNLGAAQRDRHERIGYNFRMDGLQGAWLKIKLAHVRNWNTIRQEHAALYAKLLATNVNIELPRSVANCEHIYHLFVIRTTRRDSLRDYLRTKGIETLIHYPIPCHLQKAFDYLGYKPGDLPNAEKFSRQILSLPVSEQHSKDQIEYTAERINEFFC